MDDQDQRASGRRNQLFHLLQQQSAGNSPAQKAAKAASRYLDDVTADQIRGRAITSLKGAAHYDRGANMRFRLSRFGRTPR